jgi:CIC family chloride channel protein
MDTVRVEEVMVGQPVTIPVDLPVAELAGEFLRTGRHGFPVLNADSSLYGVVALEDYRRARAELPTIEGVAVRDIATRGVVSVYPDESISMALRRMSPRDLSRLPVVARDDPRRLVGVVRRNDIVRAYELGVLRFDDARNRFDQTRALGDARAQFIEIRLQPSASVIDKNVASVDLPRTAVIVSIRRGRDLVIPRGDTLLQSGDLITVLCEHDSIEKVRSVLTVEKPSTLKESPE